MSGKSPSLLSFLIACHKAISRIDLQPEEEDQEEEDEEELSDSLSS